MLSNQNQPGIGSAKSSGGGSASLDVGVTPVVNGVSGRVFFQGAGDVLQQSSDLFWDQTNSRLSIGQGNTPAARLDIRAQGGLSTDVILNIQNSNNTSSLFNVRGDSIFEFPTYILGSQGGLGSQVSFGNAGVFFTQANQFNITGSRITVSAPQGMLTTSALQNVIFASDLGGATTQIMLNYGYAQIHLGGSIIDTIDGKNVFGVCNGDVPSAIPNRFLMCSQVGRPNFILDNGDIISLYKQGLPTNPTTAEIATLLSNLGLANLV